MMIRLSKILLVLAIALYCFLVALGNVTDSAANFPALESTLMMKDVFSNSSITYRAINNPVMHHLAFIVIICCEAMTSLLCALGAWNLFRLRHASAQVFNDSKTWAIAGLTLGFLTWHVLFMSLAGEWFGVWMSSSLRGALTSSFQIFMTILGVLIYLILKDE